MTESIADVGISSFQTAVQTLSAGLATFIPRLIVALFALIVLWVVAVMLGRLVEQLIRSLKIDSLLEGLGAEEPLSRAGYRLNVGAFVGGIVKWFFIIIGFLVAVDVLQLSAVSQFLSEAILSYLPNVIVAALILIAAAVLGDIAQKVVRGSAQAAGMPSAHLAGTVTRWAIWIFALAAALIQLRVTPELINNLVMAFVAMLALAGGLAFGLGGKEHASQLIEKLKRDIRG